MKKNLISLLTILFALSAAGILKAQESYKLKYNFEKGKTYKYLASTTGNVTQSMMGQEMKIGIDSKIYLKIETENAGENFSLITSIDSGSVRTNMPMKDTTVSLKEIEGKRTRLLLEKNGKISKKEVIDSVKTGMESMGLNEMTKFAVLPEKDFKFGETWNNQDIDSVDMMGGKIKTTSNIDYTLLGRIDTLGHNCLKIGFAGKTSSEGSTKIMGMELFIEGNGKTSGMVYFNAAKGLVVYVEALTDNEMTMAATGEQNMIIPITQSMVSKQTLLDK